MNETRFQTLADVVRAYALTSPGKAALVEGSGRQSYADLDSRSNAVARALLQAGIRPGDRVAVLDRDSMESVLVLMGISKAGGVYVGVNWRLAPPEVSFILEDSGSKLVFVGAELEPRFSEVLRQVPGPPRVVVLRGKASNNLDAFCGHEDHSDPHVPRGREDLAAQLYTSGTTGRPKGVMLANRSFFAVVESLRRAGDPWIGFGPLDVTSSGLPLFHIGGIWWAMTTLSHGATLVLMDSFAGWKVLELIEKHRITKFCLVPAMIGIVVSEPGIDRSDTSSLQCLVYGGSPIPRPILERALARFRCGFAQIYGLTETGNTAVCLRPKDHMREDLRLAAGRPYPGVEVKVIDSQGKTLPPRSVGEICLRSPANMLGYWNREEATRATLIDGFVHTGDAGYLDEQGYVFVSDRIKDMIISAGENIYPAEVESVLCGHPAVLEAAVIGIPDDRWGEVVKAVLVPRPGQTIDATQILAHARQSLADFKVPRVLEVVESLPRTPSGKLKKHEVRAGHWAGRERPI